MIEISEQMTRALVLLRRSPGGAAVISEHTAEALKRRGLVSAEPRDISQRRFRYPQVRATLTPQGAALAANAEHRLTQAMKETKA